MAGQYDQGWNDALNEIAKRAALLPFGKDTRDSLVIWTKEAKHMPPNMTLEEQERWLWVEGEVGNATILGKQIDLQNQVENQLEDLE